MNLSRTLLLFLLPCSLYGQLDTAMTATGYILKMNNTLNLRFDLDNDVRSFEFNTTEDTYSILPNTRMRMAIAYNYRFITLKVGFSPEFLAAGDSDQKGNTRLFRLTLDMFLGDFYQTFDYNRIKGYYIEGFDQGIPPAGQPAVEYLILPDMATWSFTGTTRYRFNENFSFKALVNQTEIQTKSAGSFVPELIYGYWEIKHPSGPQDIESFYVIANAGYQHTFVLNRNWYANLGLSLGMGVEFSKIDTRIGEIEYTDRVTSEAVDFNVQMGLGYNTKRFYAGTALIGNAITRGEASVIKFNNVRGYFKVFVGYRFDPPRFLIETMDWIESKNPFQKK